MAIRPARLTKLPNTWSTRKCFNIFSGFLKDPVVFLWTREKASAGLGLKFRKSSAFIYLYLNGCAFPASRWKSLPHFLEPKWSCCSPYNGNARVEVEIDQ
jgi:hypothetical protein